MPNCPIHNVPMRPSNKGGGFFCSQKMPDGTYCKEKVKGEAAPPPAAPAGAPAPVPPAPTQNYMDAELAAECMKFAVGIKDQHPDDRDALVKTAVEAYKAFKAVM